MTLLGIPVLVREDSIRELKHGRTRAVSAQPRPAISTEEVLTTGYDAANRATPALWPAEELNLVGIAVHEPKNGVDNIFQCAHLHP